jgi:polyisoprenoid-binding protein YceI
MKSGYLFLILSTALLLPACRSEISDKPAAEVTQPSAVQPRTNENAVTQPVIREKSSIDFVGAKVTRDHQGKFHTFDGSIDYVEGKPVGVSFDIDLTSVETDTPRLTEHLKSADFFDVAQYPAARFKSTALTESTAAAGATHQLRGVLEMHGVSKEVAFPVTAQVGPDGVRTLSEFTINRHDWGISYRGAADDLIRDDVLIKLNLFFPPPPESV